MDAVFYFLFYDDDRCDADGERIAHNLAFYVTNMTRPWSEIEDDVYESAAQLEGEYGVHDWLTSPAGVPAVGYASYEVQADRYDELMQEWRQAFVYMDPGCVVSEVFEVPNMNDMNDAEILQFTKDAHEQFLADQQRGVLDAHVTTSSTTIASKKM